MRKETVMLPVCFRKPIFSYIMCVTLIALCAVAIPSFEAQAETLVQSHSLEFDSVGVLGGTSLLSVANPAYGGLITLNSTITEPRTSTTLDLSYGGGILFESADFRYSYVRTGTVPEAVKIHTKGLYALSFVGLDDYPVWGVIGIKLETVKIVGIETCRVVCSTPPEAHGTIWRPVFGAMGELSIWRNLSVRAAYWVLGENDLNIHRGKTALTRLGTSSRLLLGISLNI